MAYCFHRSKSSSRLRYLVITVDLMAIHHKLLMVYTMNGGIYTTSDSPCMFLQHYTEKAEAAAYETIKRRGSRMNQFYRWDVLEDVTDGQKLDETVSVCKEESMVRFDPPDRKNGLYRFTDGRRLRNIWCPTKLSMLEPCSGSDRPFRRCLFTSIGPL